jgi:type IV pilus assembly protein PilW
MGTVMNRQKGFSLVEVVVGLGIGMISMVIIMQVFAVFEGGKRSTTAGTDAQNNGALALYMIEQDARMSGWGMDTSVYANCNTTYSYCDGSAACGGGIGALSNLSFASLKLVDGGTNPDSLSAQFYSDPKESTFRLPGNTTLQRTMPQSSSELNVGSVSGCEDGDLVLVAQAGNCTLMQITQIQGQALKIQHNPGASGPFNPPASYQNANNWPAYSTGARLSCFKPPSVGAFFQRTYSIDPTNRQLVRTDAGTPEVIAPEILDLQVQYGVAPAGGSQSVNAWVDPSGPTWSNPTQADAKRIKAIRVALVARSTQYERPESGTCQTTTPAMVSNWSSWAVFNTANYPQDWQCYRYKVFETVVPLRNVIWGNL